jgi:hypothetical protein
MPIATDDASAAHSTPTPTVGSRQQELTTKLRQISDSFAEGFLDGLGAGLFTHLRRPGAPDELIDSRSIEEFMSCGEFDEIKNQFVLAVKDYEENRARSSRGLYWAEDAREVVRKYGL